MADEYIERKAAIDCLHFVCVPQCRKYAQEEIMKIPAADVRPVRHGRWSREKNCETGYEIWVNVCSACGAITPVNVSRYKYCPRCGALMDEEG